MIVSEENLLACVSNYPESTNALYRRYAGIPERKNLTKRRRHERRAIGMKLEEMARRGVIRRSEGDSAGHPIPTYSLA